MTYRNALRWVAVVGATAGLAATPTLASAHSSHASKRHHSHIPQHNGGDHDADNRGGPSDGDGNI
jgi:hypothetical protein